jgi:hypothetical protein
VPASVLAGDVRGDWTSAPLAELVSPLVVEADGTVVPLQYGFARRYELGRLSDATLREMDATWRVGRYHDFASLCRRTWEALTGSAQLPMLGWYRAIARAAANDEMTQLA